MADSIKTESLANLTAITELSASDVLPVLTGSDKKLKKLTWQNLLSAMYPVGAIYVSVNEANPATLFGGTWEQIKDCFLLAAGSSYTAGSTGGAATVALSAANLPAHTHSIPALSGTAASAGAHTHTATAQYNKDAAITGSSARIAGGGSNSTTSPISIGSAGAHTHTVTTKAATSGSQGSGTAHNNMPPYLAVYVWKRTA